MDQETLQNLIKESFENGYTYEEYVQLIENLLKEGKSTAPEQTEDLTAYSEMNLRRMKRWNKRFKTPAGVQEKMEQEGQNMNWLVLSEGWCGDAAHSLPIMAKLAEFGSMISLRILLRDQNEQLMEQFLTNGGKSIPKLIAYKPETKKIIGTWGPRPEQAQQILRNYQAKHGSLDDTIKEQLQICYNKDKGESIAEELITLFD